MVIQYKQRGFTMIELLLVLALVGILGSILAPTLMSARLDRQDTIIVDRVTEQVRRIAHAAGRHALNNTGIYPDEANGCVGAYALLVGEGRLTGIPPTAPTGVAWGTQCVPGTSFAVTARADTVENAQLVANQLTGSVVVGVDVTANYPYPTLLAALEGFLRLDGTNAMLADLDVGVNDIVNVETMFAENVELESVEASASQGIYFAGVVGNNTLLDKPVCPAGTTPTIIVIAAGLSDEGIARPIGSYYAYAEEAGGGQWRVKLRANVFSEGAWQEVEPSANFGKLAVFEKCS